MKMRIPINKEYDKPVEVTGSDDEKMHWKDMFSHVDDTENEYNLPAAYLADRGYYSARHWHYNSASDRYVDLGFRPAVDLNPDTLPSDIKEGDTLVIGTLYMNGTPVHVPENPTKSGDIEYYIPGATLELWNPVKKDPKYQITGIYIGNGVVVADRVMLRSISYKDLELQHPLPDNIHASDLIARLQAIMDVSGEDPEISFEAESWSDDLEELEYRQMTLSSITIEDRRICIRTDR